MLRYTAAWCVVAASAVGCSVKTPIASTPSQPSAAASSSAHFAGPSTIEQVWAIMGCTEDQVIFSSPMPRVYRGGACGPGPKLASFYQFSSPGEAESWLQSGHLLVDPGETAFTAGSVVVLTTDADTAQQLSGLLFTRYPK